ncbi:hypothetical protein E2I00_020075, partial [Balaenoptera physalus]
SSPYIFDTVTNKDNPSVASQAADTNRMTGIMLAKARLIANNEIRSRAMVEAYWEGKHIGLNYSNGKFEDIVSSTARTYRLDVNASQIMKIINMTTVSEMNEPIDEIGVQRIRTGVDKRLDPLPLQVSNIVTLAASTGKDNRSNTAVINTDRTNSGYTVQPVPALASTIDDASNNKKEGGSSQKLMLFTQGKAISDALIIGGTSQFLTPPIMMGMTLKKNITNAWVVTTTLIEQIRIQKVEVMAEIHYRNTGLQDSNVSKLLYIKV